MLTPWGRPVQSSPPKSPISLGPFTFTALPFKMWSVLHRPLEFGLALSSRRWHKWCFVPLGLGFTRHCSFSYPLWTLGPLSCTEAQSHLLVDETLQGGDQRRSSRQPAPTCKHWEGPSWTQPTPDWRQPCEWVQAKLAERMQKQLKESWHIRCSKVHFGVVSDVEGEWHAAVTNSPKFQWLTLWFTSHTQSDVGGGFFSLKSCRNPDFYIISAGACTELLTKIVGQRGKKEHGDSMRGLMASDVWHFWPYSIGQNSVLWSCQWQNVV